MALSTPLAATGAQERAWSSPDAISTRVTAESGTRARPFTLGRWMRLRDINATAGIVAAVLALIGDDRIPMSGANLSPRGHDNDFQFGFLH